MMPFLVISGTETCGWKSLSKGNRDGGIKKNLVNLVNPDIMGMSRSEIILET